MNTKTYSNGRSMRRGVVRAAIGASLAFVLAGGISSGSPEEDGVGFEITWYTIDGGGGTSVGGGFELNGTIGQHDAGAAMGSGFELTGGFWVGGGEAVPLCPGDLNGDNEVNSDDLSILLGAFASNAAGDLNNDGVTNSDDLSILLSEFGTVCG